MELFKEIIGAIYLLLPIPVTIGYFPVLLDVFKNKQAQCIISWGIWTATIILGTLYVILWTNDIKLWTIYIFETIFITAIWVGSIIYRKNID